jgi:hypothetical protein
VAAQNPLGDRESIDPATLLSSAQVRQRNILAPAMRW